MAEIPSEVRSSEKEQAPQCGVATIEDADICRRQKRPGVLSCAVREAGIPPAVRARILTERKSIARSKGFARPLRLRNCPFCHISAPASRHPHVILSGIKWSRRISPAAADHFSVLSFQFSVFIKKEAILCCIVSFSEIAIKLAALALIELMLFDAAASPLRNSAPSAPQSPSSAFRHNTSAQ